MIRTPRIASMFDEKRGIWWETFNPYHAGHANQPMQNTNGQPKLIITSLPPGFDRPHFIMMARCLPRFGHPNMQHFRGAMGHLTSFAEDEQHAEDIGEIYLLANGWMLKEERDKPCEVISSTRIHPSCASDEESLKLARKGNVHGEITWVHLADLYQGHSSDFLSFD